MLFKQFLKEATENKIYYIQDTLWVAYGEGSGMTSYMPDTKKYLTDKKGDKNFDSLVPKLVKYAKVTKPLKKQGDAKLFELPVYELGRQSSVETLDVWGGARKPVNKFYIIITTNKAMTVVNVFEKKNEAMAWINSISENVNEDKSVQSTQFDNEFQITVNDAKTIAKNYGQEWYFVNKDEWTINDGRKHIMTYMPKKGELYTDFSEKEIIRMVKGH